MSNKYKCIFSTPQVYIIEVKVGDHSWTVKHRYSDFHDLHEKVSYADTFLKPKIRPQILTLCSQGVTDKTD